MCNCDEEDNDGDTASDEDHDINDAGDGDDVHDDGDQIVVVVVLPMLMMPLLLLFLCLRAVFVVVSLFLLFCRGGCGGGAADVGGVCVCDAGDIDSVGDLGDIQLKYPHNTPIMAIELVQSFAASKSWKT